MRLHPHSQVVTERQIVIVIIKYWRFVPPEATRPLSGAAGAFASEFLAPSGDMLGYARERLAVPWPGQGWMNQYIQPSLDSIHRGLSSVVSGLEGLSSLVDDEEVHDARELAPDGVLTPGGSALVLVAVEDRGGAIEIIAGSRGGVRSCSAPPEGP